MARGQIRRRGHRQHQRRRQSIRFGEREQKVLFAVSYVGAAITNILGYWGPSWIWWVWFILPAWMILRRVHFRVRMPRMRHMRFDINLSSKSLKWVGGVAYVLIAASYFLLGWGPDWLWIWWFVLPGLLGLVLLARKYPGLVGGLFQRVGEVRPSGALKGAIEVGLLIAALWRYFSVSSLGTVDAVALMLVWSLVTYLWWPRNSLHGPQLDSRWKRVLWAVVRLVVLAFLLVTTWWLSGLGFVPTMIALMALEVYALWAWSHPHPIHGPLPTTGVINLPIPRVIGIQIIPLIFIEGVLFAAAGLGQWYVGLPAVVWVMTGLLAIVIFWLYVNRWKSSNLAWMSVVLDITNSQMAIDTGIAGAPKIVTFAKLGAVSFVDTPAAEDLLFGFLGTRKFKAEVIGGGAVEFLLVVRGAAFPRNPDNIQQGMLKGGAAVMACFGWLSKQQNGVRR